MIKIIIDKDKGIDLDIRGGYVDIISDVTMVVRTVYEQLNEHDKELGDRFKKDFKNAVKKDLMFLTKEELIKVTKEAFEKLKKALGDNIGIIDDIISEDKDEADKNKKEVLRLPTFFLGGSINENINE